MHIKTDCIIFSNTYKKKKTINELLAINLFHYNFILFLSYIYILFSKAYNLLKNTICF